MRKEQAGHPVSSAPASRQHRGGLLRPLSLPPPGEHRPCPRPAQLVPEKGRGGAEPSLPHMQRAPMPGQTPRPVTPPSGACHLDYWHRSAGSPGHGVR